MDITPFQRQGDVLIHAYKTKLTARTHRKAQEPTSTVSKDAAAITSALAMDHGYHLSSQRPASDMYWEPLARGHVNQTIANTSLKAIKLMHCIQINTHHLAI
jgi:hypothetical protein